MTSSLPISRLCDLLQPFIADFRPFYNYCVRELKYTKVDAQRLFFIFSKMNINFLRTLDTNKYHNVHLAIATHNSQVEAHIRVAVRINYNKGVFASYYPNASKKLMEQEEYRNGTINEDSFADDLNILIQSTIIEGYARNASPEEIISRARRDAPRLLDSEDVSRVSTTAQTLPRETTRVPLDSIPGILASIDMCLSSLNQTSDIGEVVKKFLIRNLKCLACIMPTDAVDYHSYARIVESGAAITEVIKLSLAEYMRQFQRFINSLISSGSEEAMDTVISHYRRIVREETAISETPRFTDEDVRELNLFRNLVIAGTGQGILFINGEYKVLKKSQVDKLLKELEEEDDSEENCCGICLNNPATESCGNKCPKTICIACNVIWRQNHNTCPNCRQPFKL